MKQEKENGAAALEAILVSLALASVLVEGVDLTGFIQGYETADSLCRDCLQWCMANDPEDWNTEDLKASLVESGVDSQLIGKCSVTINAGQTATTSYQHHFWTGTEFVQRESRTTSTPLQVEVSYPYSAKGALGLLSQSEDGVLDIHASSRGIYDTTAGDTW